MAQTRHIALIGSHHRIFEEKLKTEGYKVTKHRDYHDHKASSHKPHAIALHGHDQHFADHTELTTLLDSNVAILVFAPSEDVLIALRKAAQTPVDLKAVKVGEGVPIIVHKQPKTNDVHITPGFKITLPVKGITRNAGESAIETSFPSNASGVASPEAHIAHAVKLLGKSIDLSASHDPTVAVAAPDLVDGLTPPIVTSFFNKTIVHNTTTCGINQIPWDGSSQDWIPLPAGESEQLWDFDWILSLYSYATGANPTAPNFAANGGVVYVIAVHTGQLNRDPNGPKRYFGPQGGDGDSETEHFNVDHIKLSLADTNNLLVTNAQLPRTESGVKTNNAWSYDLTYQQTFQMLKDNGSTPVSFQAQYANPFLFDQFKQTSIVEQHDMFFSIDYLNDYDRNGDPDFNTDRWYNWGVYDRNNTSNNTVHSLPTDSFNFNGVSIFTSNLGSANLACSADIEFTAFKSYTAYNFHHFTVARWDSTPTINIPLDLSFKNP